MEEIEKETNVDSTKEIPAKNANHEYFSREVSKFSRQLSLAGIAVIWLFKINEPNSAKNILSSDFKLPLILFISGLGIDFIHYFLGALFSHIKDASKGELSNAQNYTINILFYLKCAIVIIAFILLICGIINSNNLLFQ